MKITKIRNNVYEVSDISVREVLNTIETMSKEYPYDTMYICYAIRARAMQKIQRKGIDHAIRNYHNIIATNTPRMSAEVIRSVMLHVEPKMTKYVKQLFHKESGIKIEGWSNKVSWHAFLNNINETCELSAGTKNEHTAFRMNILSSILRENPKAKLDNLNIEMMIR